jgi:hypothetical protein
LRALFSFPFFFYCSPSHRLVAPSVHPHQPPQKKILGIDEDLSFDKGFFLTIRAIQLLKKQSGGKPILVGIAGPSGAGKTVFCQKIQDFMYGFPNHHTPPP